MTVDDEAENGARDSREAPEALNPDEGNSTNQHVGADHRDPEQSNTETDLTSVVEPAPTGFALTSNNSSADTPAKSNETAMQTRTQQPSGKPEKVRKRLRPPWFDRKSVRALRDEYSQSWGQHRQLDEMFNAETRLPPDEAVHLGGITLVEAFTPSTVANLYTSLRDWQGRNPYRDRDWSAELQSRRASSQVGGWSNLGFVRPEGSQVFGMGFTDPTLPDGVDAVWLSVSYVTPSVAIVSATFTISEASADLSEILRTDRRNAVQDVKIIVPGRLGAIRAKIPWARPRSHGMTSKGDDVWTQKNREVEAVVQRFENTCGDWFYGKFNGRFSQLEPFKRPSVRIMFTEKDQPFQDEGRGPLSPAGLGWSWQVFAASGKSDNGWWLSINDPQRNNGKHLWTVAARRADAGDPDHPDERGTTNWSLTQRFGTNQTGLVAVQALQALLDEFGAELARLRDQSHHKRRFARPVADARKLNRYLLTDGLDASTIGPDVVLLTRSRQLFRWGMPDYTEYKGASARRRTRPPADLVPSLRRNLRSQAKTLGRKGKETDRNLRASAELRQAVANTRMQRVVVAFTIVAVVIAVVSLLIALTSSPT